MAKRTTDNSDSRLLAMLLKTADAATLRHCMHILRAAPRGRTDITPIIADSAWLHQEVAAQSLSN